MRVGPWHVGDTDRMRDLLTLSPRQAAGQGAATGSDRQAGEALRGVRKAVEQEASPKVISTAAGDGVQ